MMLVCLFSMGFFAVPVEAADNINLQAGFIDVYGQPVLTNMATRLDTTRILVLRHCWVHPKISGLRDGFGGLVKCGHIARISTIRRPVR